MNNLGGVYGTGTVTIAAGGVAVTGVGTLWSPVAEVGDWLLINGQVGLILTVTDDTHLTLQSPWTGTLPSAASYTLIKLSWLRYEPALTQAKTRDMLTALAAQGSWLFTLTAPPDPALGFDGQWALKSNAWPWRIWLKTGGVWVEQTGPATGVVGPSTIEATMLNADFAAEQLAFRDRMNFTSRAGDTVAGQLLVTKDTSVIVNPAHLSPFDVVTTGLDATRGIGVTHYSSDLTAASLTSRKARGTPTAPTAILTDDELFRLRAEGFDGAAFLPVARVLIARAKADWSPANHAMQVAIASVPSGSTAAIERLFVQPSGNVTIGTPFDIGETLTVNRNTGTPPVAASGSVVQFVGGDTLAARLTGTAFGNNAAIELRRMDGTLGTPTAIASGVVIGRYSANAYNGVGFGAQRAASLSLRSTQAWTPTAQGASAVIEFTPNNSVTITDHTTFDELGITTKENIYLGNAKRIYGRNLANSAWLEILRLSTSDICQVGFGATSVAFQPPATFVSTVTLAADPASALQAATKQYVDNVLGGAGTLNTVRVVDTSDSNPSATAYAAGQVFDGVTLAAGDRVLRAATLHPERNGIWTAPASGAATRPADKSVWIQLRGVAISVQEGSVNHDTVWLCTSDGVQTLGSVALTFVPIVSSASRDLLDDTSVAAMRTTLGLAIGTDVQAWSAALDAVSAQLAYDGPTNKFVGNARLSLNRNPFASAIEGSLAGITEGIFRTVEVDGASANWQGISYGGTTGIGIRGYSARGTSSVPTKALSGDSAVNIGAYPHDGTAFPSGATSRIRLESSQDQSATAHGSQITLWVTPNNSVTLGLAVTIQNDSTLLAAAGIRSQSPTAGVGYVAGAGGSVTQATDKSTGVTLSKTTGQIIMHAASLTNSTTVSFIVTNTTVAATDNVIVNISGGIATAGTYAVGASVGSGTFTISVRNQSAAPLAEAIQLTFSVIKGSHS